MVYFWASSNEEKFQIYGIFPALFVGNVNLAQNVVAFRAAHGHTAGHCHCHCQSHLGRVELHVSMTQKPYRVLMVSYSFSL